MAMPRHKASVRKRKKAAARLAPADLLKAVITNSGDPARILELYYWSREPGLLEMIRAIVAMRPSSVAALEAFLAMTPDRHSIVATLEGTGRLTLDSPQVAQAIIIAEYISETEAPAADRVLN
jgi:hypothetical protein